MFEPPIFEYWGGMMKRKFTSLKILCSIVIVLLALSMTACREKKSDKTVLRLVIEAQHDAIQDATISLNSEIYRRVTSFEAQHENVDVVLEELPKAGNERELVIERLRAELMAGKGADVMILPSSSRWVIPGVEIFFGAPLIADVNQAMHNGAFTDISEYYDSDTELDKEGLQNTVMDAGKVGDARYALPLRFNYPVICVDKERALENGLELSLFEQDVITIMDTLSQLEDKRITASLSALRDRDFALNYFSDLLDYQNQEILLSQEELTSFMRSYQSYRVSYSTKYPWAPVISQMPAIFNYAEEESGLYWDDAGCFMQVVDLDYVIQTASMASAMGIDMGIYPLRATGGSVVANVTYYGAVGAGSKNPELAYEFLSYFLSPDVQWEKNRDAHGILNARLIGEGWPVRAKGAVPYLSYNIYKQLAGFGDVDKQNLSRLDLLTKTDEDIPVAEITIDKARFPVPLGDELIAAMDSLYETITVSSVEPETAAAEFIEELEWHLGEG